MLPLRALLAGGLGGLRSRPCWSAAPHSFIGTFDGHPYVAPFSGNITELCPVGALTSTAYRFRARPWDINELGHPSATRCPSQCNIHFTVRDERVMRVLERQNDEVDDGWLCDKGRFGYELIESDRRVTEPLVRVGDKLRATSWDQAFERIVEGLGAAGAASAALAGGETSNEEGYLLQRLMRRGLGSSHVDSRSGGPLDPAAARLLARPELAATVSDIDHAGAVLVVDAEPVDDAAIFDLRVRKAVSRNGARLVVATGRPSTLDGGAGEVLRFAPGQAEAVLRALTAALDGAERAGLEAALRGGRPGAARPEGRRQAALRRRRRGGALGRAHRPRPARGRGASGALQPGPGAGPGQGRGLRVDRAAGRRQRSRPARGGLPAEPGPRPGRPGEPPGRDAAGIAEAAAAGDLRALFLLHTDPVADHPDREAWEEALSKAGFVAAQTLFLSAGIAEHADVVLPAESYAEKDGTLTHPDGRLQRQRPAVGRPGSVRMGWQVLADLCRALGDDTGVLTGPMATDALAAEVPFYAGLDADEIGGLGVRWQEREAAGAAPAAPLEPFKLGRAPAAPQPPKGDRVLVHTYRPIWSGDAVDHSPPLSFLRQRQRLELAPGEADRLGLTEGDAVELRAGDRGLRAEVVVRDGLAPGAAFLIEGTAEEPANLLAGAEPVLVDVARAEPRPADAEIALPVAGGAGG